MSSSLRPLFAFVPSILMSLFVFASGCGNEGPSPDPLGRGFTDCNGATCQPGQYCRLAAFCENGCLSDVNCTDSQRCVDVGSGTFGEGRCETAVTMTPDAGGPTETLDPGFTRCLGLICQPGQYCRGGAFCENGCLSEANCTEAQRCVDVGSGTFGEGRCEIAMTMTPDAGTPDASGPGPNEQCVRLCNALVTCDPSGSLTFCLNHCPTWPADCRSCLDGAGSSCDLAETCASQC